MADLAADAVPPTFIRKAATPNAPQKLTGAIARSAFVAGEPIREAKLIKANGSGFMAAHPAVRQARHIDGNHRPETSAGGFILPNDHVDVILSRREKDAKGDRFVSETILTNVRVLAIDQTIGEKDGQKVVIGKTATLELTPRPGRDARAIAPAEARCRWRCAASPTSSAMRQTHEMTPRNRRGINMVRYGVSTTTSIK